MRPVDSLPPGLLIGEKLTEETGLCESSSRDRRCAPVGFEEEERASPVLRRFLEAETEDPIRLDAQSRSAQSSAESMRSKKRFPM